MGEDEDDEADSTRSADVGLGGEVRRVTEVVAEPGETVRPEGLSSSRRRGWSSLVSSPQMTRLARAAVVLVDDDDREGSVREARGSGALSDRDWYDDPCAAGEGEARYAAEEPDEDAIVVCDRRESETEVVMAGRSEGALDDRREDDAE